MSSLRSSERFTHLMCSICLDNLFSECPKKKRIVHTGCGHVFHDKCLQSSYKAKGSFVTGCFRCPYCRNLTDSDSSQELYLQNQIDYDAMALANVNRSLVVENAELKKQLNVSEMRILFLDFDKEQLFHKMNNLTWTDLTDEVQHELRKKIETSLNAVNIHNLTDLSFLRSNTMMQIIKSEPNKTLLISNIVEDYLDNKLCLNARHTLDDCKQIFKNDFHERLAVACNLSSLSLYEIPVSRSIMQMVTCLENEKQSRTYDKSVLGKIAETYLTCFSNCHINELCRIRLIQLISTDVSRQIEFQIPCTDNSNFDFLLRNGALKNTMGHIDFPHKLIKYYISGIIVCSIIETFGMSFVNARQFVFGRDLEKNSLEEYCVRYLQSSKKSSDKNQSMDVLNFIEAFNIKDTDNMKLLAILAVRNLKKTKDLAKVIECCQKFVSASGKTVWEIEFPCIIENADKFLTLSHFAALRGDKTIIQELYSLFESAGEAKRFDLEELVHYCSSWTLSSSVEELQQREDVIKFILLLMEKRDCKVNKGKSDNIPKTVHISLIRFLLRLEVFKDIWSIDQILYDCLRFLSKAEVIDLIHCVHNPDEWVKIVEVYICNRTT